MRFQALPITGTGKALHEDVERIDVGYRPVVIDEDVRYGDFFLRAVLFTAGVLRVRVRLGFSSAGAGSAATAALGVRRRRAGLVG